MLQESSIGKVRVKNRSTCMYIIIEYFNCLLEVLKSVFSNNHIKYVLPLHVLVPFSVQWQLGLGVAEVTITKRKVSYKKTTVTMNNSRYF